MGCDRNSEGEEKESSDPLSHHIESDKTATIEKQGSKYLRQFSTLLSQIESEKRSRFSALKDEKILEIEMDDTFDRLWLKEDVIGFVNHWKSYSSRMIPLQLNQYKEIVEQPVDLERPDVHFNEGREWLFSVMRQLHYVYQRFTEINTSQKLMRKIQEEEQQEANVIDFSIELALAWMLRCYFTLGENFEKTGEHNAASERFAAYLRLWLGLSPIRVSLELHLVDQPYVPSFQSNRYLAWDSEEGALIELLKVLNSIGIAMCQRTDYWGGIGFFKRAQAYTGLGTLQLGFRYCAETVRLQRLNLIQQIEQLQAPVSSNTPPVDLEELAPSCASTASELDAVGVPASPGLSNLLHTLREWINSVTNLSDFFLNRQSYASAELLLHSALQILERVRGKGPWSGYRARESIELEAILHRSIAQYLVYRMRTSTSVMSQPGQTLPLLEDAAKELLVHSVEEIKNATVDAHFLLNTDEINGETKPNPFNIELTKLPPELRIPPDHNDDLLWEYSLTPKFNPLLPEVVDIPSLEESDWIQLGETFIISNNQTSVTSLNETLGGPCIRFNVDGGTIFIRFSEALNNGTNEEHLITSRLNSPVIDCEYIKNNDYDTNKSNDANRIERRIPQNLLQFKPQLDRISPFLCLNQMGIHQLQRLVNHYIRLALEPAFTSLMMCFQHFKLNGWVTDHCHLILLQSAAYRYLSLHELDPKTFGSIQNRRLKLLAPLLDKLSPVHYNHFISQIAFECGEICQELLSLKMTNKSPLQPQNTELQEASFCRHFNPKLIRAIHNIRKQGIHYYTIYFESLKRQFGGTLPDVLSAEHWDAYFATRFATLQLLSSCNRFVSKFEPATPSMCQELSEAITICQEIGTNAFKWSGSCEQPACGTDQLQVAECMAQILPAEIEKLRRILAEQARKE